MKKIVMCLMTICMSLLFNPKGLNAAAVSSAKYTTEQSVKGENINVLTNRLKEIKAIDKSKLTSDEKKALRKEVQIIKNEVLDHPIYISGAALIIIILLLIILV